MNTITIRMDEAGQRHLLAFCRERDVRKAGVFDVRGDAYLGCVNIWSIPWLDDDACARSQPVGEIRLHPGYIEIEGSVPLQIIGLPVPAKIEREPVVAEV